MASIIIFPAAYTFINSARTNWEGELAYNFIYYKKIIEGLISIQSAIWHYTGVASIVLLMIPKLFTNIKKNKSIIIYFLIMTAMILIPGVASSMNGFSAPSGRWTYAYTFILAYIITLGLNKNLEYSKKEIKSMIYGISIYTIVIMCINCYEKIRIDTFIFLSMAFVTLIIIIIKNTVIKNQSDKFKNSYLNKAYHYRYTILIVIIICVNITVLSNSINGVKWGNYVKQFVKNDKVTSRYKTLNGKIKDFKKAIDYINDNDKNFYRIEKSAIGLQNISMMYKYNSLSIFSSVGSKYLYELSEELESDNTLLLVHAIDKLQDRTKITTLLGLKYFITNSNDKSVVPYGYEEFKSFEGAKIYKNKTPLSIGVTYDNYILREEYNKLNPLEKEDVLLKSVIIDDESKIEGYNLNKINRPKEILSEIGEVNYKVVENSNLIKSNSIEINNKDNKKFIKLLTDNINNSEVYVYIKNLKFKPKDSTKKEDYKISAKSDGIHTREQVKDISYTYYRENPDILLNLGYCENQKKEIEIHFGSEGDYTYDWIKVFRVSMDKYEDTINKLQLSELKDIEYSNSYIKGKLNLKKDAILQISTSYTKGWRAYIDGEEVKTIPVNTAFIGVPVKEGEHEIYFKYTMPYLYEGIGLTTIGVIVFGAIWIYERNNKNNYIKGL